MEEIDKTTDLLKNMSKIFIVEFILNIICYIIAAIRDELGMVDIVSLILIVSPLAFLFLTPAFISGICGLRYCLGKNNGKLTACWIWGIISLLVNFGLIYMSEELGEFFTLIFLFLLTLPNILYLIGCFQKQLKNKNDI